MKNCYSLCFFILCFMGFSAPLFASCGTVDTSDFQVIMRELDAALEIRNFQKSRKLIEEVIPMMKEDLKANKKILSGLKKEEVPAQDPQEFQKRMERKTELYNDLKELVDISPAALRVKSESIKKNLKEYLDLS